jgi:hypothetical protein
MAAWERLVITPKGNQVDAPEPHPLAYFTQYPSLLDESGDFCYLCTPERRFVEAKKIKSRTAVKLIGTVNGFAAYDVFYYFNDHDRPDWKSILVQTGPRSYREIYHDQPSEGYGNPSFLLKAGRETLLGVVDNVYRWDNQEEYFWFGADGVVRLNFAPVWEAAQKIAPKGREIWGHDLNGPVNFPTLTISVGLRFSSNGHCCDVGVIQVKFKLDRGRVLVTGTNFDQDAKY